MDKLKNRYRFLAQILLINVIEFQSYFKNFTKNKSNQSWQLNKV